MKEKIILVGGGGHCKSCIDVIEQENKFEIYGIIDTPEKIGGSILGYSIFATDDDIVNLAKTYKYYIVTVGYIKSFETRVRLFNFLSQLDVTLPNIVSPFAYVSRHAKLGVGNIIMHHATINASACIGDNCIINSDALIEHDAVIGNHCHISTNAVINGGVEVGEFTFFGSGAVSKQYIQIPPKSFIKANSLVK